VHVDIDVAIDVELVIDVELDVAVAVELDVAVDGDGPTILTVRGNTRRKGGSLETQQKHRLTRARAFHDPRSHSIDETVFCGVVDWAL
jgi:hypothetical protein